MNNGNQTMVRKDLNNMMIMGNFRYVDQTRRGDGTPIADITSVTYG